MQHKIHQLMTFLPQRMRQEIRELYSSALILNFGLALIFIFEPIYLFRLGYSLQQIMLFWVMVYGIYVFTLPLGAKVAERFGYEHTMFYGTFFWILLYLSMYMIQIYPVFFYITPLIYVLQKSLYWPAYHADFAKYSEGSEGGREISTLTTLNSLIFIIGPALGGFILYEWGFSVLFILVSVIFLLSNIPMLITKEKFVPVKIDYEHSLKRLFRPEHRKSFLAYLGFGEEILVVVVWPIFISLFIKSYLSIGGLIAATTLLTAVVTMLSGRMSDQMDKRRILRYGVSFYFISWMMRIFWHSSVGIFFTDTLSRLSKSGLIAVPLTAITYENAKNGKVINTILLFEMSLALGKFLAVLAVFILLFMFGGGLWPFYIAFIVASLLTLLYAIL
ncbi:MAG: MFS transporter [Candidatus Komeilibacteria bacterium]